MVVSISCCRPVLFRRDGLVQFRRVLSQVAVLHGKTSIATPSGPDLTQSSIRRPSFRRGSTYGTATVSIVPIHGTTRHPLLSTDWPTRTTKGSRRKPEGWRAWDV